MARALAPYGRGYVMITGALLAFTWASAALPASATHTRVVQLGNGQRVILAERGNEKYVRLPNGKPNARLAVVEGGGEYLRLRQMRRAAAGPSRDPRVNRLG